MKENETLIRINPIDEEESDFAKTGPISFRAVSHEISLNDIAYLDIRCPESDSVRVQLEKGEITLGRSSKCRVQINLPNVSRLHARITFQREEYGIEDLNSTNGTYVNGVRIKKCTLRSQDQIQIGAARLFFTEQKRPEK